MRMFLRVALCCGVLAFPVMAQRGGGGGGSRGGGGGGFRGGGGGGGFRGGGVGGFHGGGGFRGLGPSGGGFRGGGFGGSFRGSGGGFGGGFRGFGGGGGFRGFNRGFGFRGSLGFSYGPSYYGGYWPGYYDYGYYPYDYDSGYGYSYGNPGYQPSYQPASNVVVVYPQQAQSAPMYVERAAPALHEYEEYGQELRPRGAPSNAPPLYLIAFRDHTIRAAIAYWADGNTLHYVTQEHDERQAPLDTVDRELSVRLNRERRVTFSLPAGK